MHNCERLEGLTFRAELAAGGDERLELERVLGADKRHAAAR
jgi:hypothetical protein